jgi:hypothetical protein
MYFRKMQGFADLLIHWQFHLWRNCHQKNKFALAEETLAKLRLQRLSLASNQPQSR